MIDPATGRCWWIDPPPVPVTNTRAVDWRLHTLEGMPLQHAVMIGAHGTTAVWKTDPAPLDIIIDGPPRSAQRDPWTVPQSKAAMLAEIMRLRAGLSQLWSLHSAPCDWHTRPGSPSCSCGTIALISELLGTEGR